jgi:hypothetical protein
MQQGLGFRVLQLEEICSNAGKLKMHGRWRLTGSHVKVNEKGYQIAVCNNLEQNHLVQIQI